ncbi:MAG: PIN domain-containing protein [Actinomycetota bacterium]|nr:PIN domain-containing protein [Actinomycetota bacterium]
MTYLLDSNVLIALLLPDHVHHEPARQWVLRDVDRHASCPITQGALLRTAIRAGATAVQAQRLLAAMLADDRHAFWPDQIGYGQVPVTGVIGHRQVTDAYLAELARARGGRLATFDQGLVEIHRDVADLVPT